MTVRKLKPKIIDCVQQGEEWFQVRTGVVTSSNFSRPLSTRKSTIEGYLDEMLAERITMVPTKRFPGNKWTRRGNEEEPRARAYHGMQTGVQVDKVGFILAGGKLAGKIGASTDGLIGKDGIAEVKTTMAKNQIRIILNDVVPDADKHQIQGGLLVTERAFCDYISWCPDMNPAYQYWYRRVERDERFISELLSGLGDFIEELDSLQNQFMTGDGSLADMLEMSIGPQGIVRFSG